MLKSNINVIKLVGWELQRRMSMVIIKPLVQKPFSFVTSALLNQHSGNTSGDKTS